jgi:pilus assembly protein CpaB
MKAARLIVLGIAIAAGGVAAMLASGSDKAPPAPPPVVQIETVDVLVAKNDIAIGRAVKAEDMQWQTWPAATASRTFIRRSERPNAIEQMAGSIARAPTEAGEPIRESRLVNSKSSGYLAAVLPSGMRAVSTEISPETGAGGFILPNDHVDVILSRRDKEAERVTGVESIVAETVLSDIRVLAIDQTVQEKDGQRVVVGRTATLELSPRQVETLGMARQMGTLSLALRSLVDSNGQRGETDAEREAKDANARGRVNMVKFGVTTTTLPK